MLLIGDFQRNNATVFLSTKNNGCPFNLNLKGGFLKSETERTDCWCAAILTQELCKITLNNNFHT